MAGCAAPLDGEGTATRGSTGPTDPAAADPDPAGPVEAQEDEQEPCPIGEGRLSGAWFERSPLPDWRALLDTAKEKFPDEDQPAPEDPMASHSSYGSLNGQESARFGPLRMHTTDPEAMQETMRRWKAHIQEVNAEMGFAPNGSWTLFVDRDQRPTSMLFREPTPDDWKPVAIMGVEQFRGNWSVFWQSPSEVRDAPGPLLPGDQIATIAQEHFHCRYGVTNGIYDGTWTVSWASYFPGEGAAARVEWEFADAVLSLHMDPWTGTIVGNEYGIG